MNFYKVHGVLQMTAFFLLFPLGAAIALFREKIGPSWKQYHIIIQLTATFIVFLAISSVLYAKSLEKQINNQTETKIETKTENKIRKTHKILGPLVVSVIIIQILWAYQGRNLVEWNTWYITHMTFSVFIIFGGITNVIFGMLM